MVAWYAPASNIEEFTAGATGGTPGSPTPAGGRSLERIQVSTCGVPASASMVAAEAQFCGASTVKRVV